MSILSVTSQDRPTIFICSSGSEKGREVAAAIKSNFDKEADVDIWHENIFAKNKSNLSNLLNRASFYDFAIAVLTADDEAEIRDENFMVPRDNVLFELGLFMGRIGAYRTFAVAEEGVRILSDFDGISISKFHWRENVVAAVGNSCNEIRREMKVAEKGYKISLLPSTALAIGYYHNFIRKVLDSFFHDDKYDLFERNENDERINIQHKNLSGLTPTLTILLPTRLSDLNSNLLKQRTSKLKRVYVQSGARPYPFYLEGDITDKNNVQFYDIPTTLSASLETMRYIFEEDFLDRDNNREHIERREIANFEKVIRKLLPDAEEDKTIKFDLLRNGIDQ
jgi:hypothetical protein